MQCSEMLKNDIIILYMLSYVIAKMKIFIPLRITAAVCQTAKDTAFNYFFMLCYTKLRTFWYIRLYETITTN